MAEYIDKPGIDLAQVVDSGRLYPVVMTIPISSGQDGAVSGESVPGFNIPEHDKIVITEDDQDITISVEYLLNGVQVAQLNFSYSDYVPSGSKTTTVEKS